MTDSKSKKKSEQLSLLKEQVSALQKASKDVSMETMRAIEDKIFEDSSKIVQDCLNFAELGFDDSGNPITPQSWEWLPTEEKEKRLRLAKATWMPSGDVPHGIKMAHATMMGIIKARAVKESGDRTLNIEFASFPAPAPLKSEVDDSDIIDVEGEG